MALDGHVERLLGGGEVAILEVEGAEDEEERGAALAVERLQEACRGGFPVAGHEFPDVGEQLVFFLIDLRFHLGQHAVAADEALDELGIFEKRLIDGDPRLGQVGGRVRRWR